MAKLQLLQRFGARLRGRRRGAVRADEAVQSPSIQKELDQTTVDKSPEEIAGEGIYEYTQLDRSLESTFRLLTLLPGPKGSQPRCTLSVSTWRDPSYPYEALSYVWGDSRSAKPIILNGKAFEVRENLFSALNQLRFQDRPRVLWVDAICIDQDSIKERNHQVASMGEIYKHCQNVLIWLRDEDGETEPVVNFIESMFDEIEQKISASPRYHDWSDLSELYTAQIPEHILEELLRPTFQVGWTSFQDYVLQCSWWSRAWIVQEYAHAPEATFHIGSFSIRWNLISGLIIVLFRALFLRGVPGHWLFGAADTTLLNSAVGLSHTRLIKQAENFREISGSSNWASPDIGFHFISLLRSQSERSCEDPRDKVYSILSMVDESFSKSLSPEYSKSAISTHVAAVKAYIDVSKRLDILSMDKEEPIQGYPSWCPNWNKTPFCQEMTHNPDLAIAIYEASRETEAVATFSENGSTLYVEGFLVCTVIDDCFQDCEGDVAYIGDDGAFQFSWNITSMAQKLRNFMVFSGNTSDTDEEVEQEQAFDVVAITLVASFWFNYTPAPPAEIDKDIGERWPGGNKAQFLIEAAIRTANRTVILTDDGNLGIASKKTKIDDEVWIFMGASTPFILRKLDEKDGDKQVRRLIGVAYVHGVMKGEAMDDLEKGKYELQTVALR